MARILGLFYSTKQLGKRMKIISVKLPEQYVEILDQLVNENVFETRSEAIRLAIKKLLQEMERLQPEE